jgi:hypothetical protein
MVRIERGPVRFSVQPGVMVMVRRAERGFRRRSTIRASALLGEVR